MDFYFSQFMINRKDFTNGVKELLINKKINSKWDPDSVKNINIKFEKYFKFDKDNLKLNFE